MSSKITVTIAGATGRFANFMVRSLLSKPNVYVHGIARTPSKVPEDVRSNPRFKIFQGDSADVKNIRKALRGANVCVCCYLGDNDLMTNGQKTLIDACIAEKVSRYVAGDWCFDYRKMKVGDHPSKDPMILNNQYLEEKEKETNGAIKGIHILNGVLIEVFWTTAFTGVYDAEGPSLSTWGSVDDTWEGITYEDAAKFTAEVAADESATGFFGGK